MPEEISGLHGPPRTKDEVALELMKFISITTGYGKGTASAGFSGTGSRNPDEHATALIELFEKCRSVVYREPEK